VGKTETLQPLETLYQGVRFRSRLEARWAVFYDNIGMPWVYEPEGYMLKDGLCYLPDFYLPKLKAFIEIKPEEPSKKEYDKCTLLAELTRKKVYLFFGPIPYGREGSYEYCCLSSEFSNSAYCFLPGERGGDYAHAWCQCPVCKRIGIQYEGRAGRLCRCTAGDHGWNPFSPTLVAAYKAARSERFGL